MQFNFLINQSSKMKTRKEVENLKQLWLDDKSAFNLAEAEGYEDHKEELTDFMSEHSEAHGFDSEMNADAYSELKAVFSHLKKSAVFGTLPGPQSMQDRIALKVIHELLKDMPDQFPSDSEERYYESIGYDAYRRTGYILNGRLNYLSKHCDCPRCRSNRQS